MRPVNRIEPNLPAHAYKTYRIDSPRDVLVKAACEQAGCLAWRHGWDTTVDETTDLGRKQADYIRRSSQRTFRETRTAEGLTVFRFEPYQRCFADHHTRPEVFSAVGGDWRQAFGPAQRYDRADQWVHDFGEHQQRLSDQQKRG